MTLESFELFDLEIDIKKSNESQTFGKLFDLINKYETFELRLNSLFASDQLLFVHFTFLVFQVGMNE